MMIVNTSATFMVIISTLLYLTNALPLAQAGQLPAQRAATSAILAAKSRLFKSESYLMAASQPKLPAIFVDTVPHCAVQPHSVAGQKLAKPVMIMVDTNVVVQGQVIGCGLVRSLPSRSGVPTQARVKHSEQY